MLIVALLSIVFYVLATGLLIRHLFTAQESKPIAVLICAKLAILLHIVELSMALIHTDQLQNFSMLNVASSIALIINIVLTILCYRQKLWVLLPASYLIACILQLMSFWVPSQYLTELDNQPGLVVHIILALASYSIMSIASLFALLHLYLNHQLKHRKKVQLVHVPPLLSIERQLIQLLKTGASLLTMTILSGFIFLPQMLTISNLDKAGVTVAAWLVYLILLWGHYRSGWRGQRLVVLTLLGNLLLAFAYFGSRILQYLLQ